MPRSTRILRGIAQVIVGSLRVGTGVATDDVTTTAADQLVDAEVFEVAAIGEVDVSLPLIRLAEELQEQWQGQRRAAGVPARAVRILDPPAEPGVEQRHDDGEQRRRVVAHIGAGGGPETVMAVPARSPSWLLARCAPAILGRGTIPDATAARVKTS